MVSLLASVCVSFTNVEVCSTVTHMSLKEKIFEKPFPRKLSLLKTVVKKKNPEIDRLVSVAKIFVQNIPRISVGKTMSRSICHICHLVTNKIVIFEQIGLYMPSNMKSNIKPKIKA